MANRTDIPVDKAYSSTVKKVYMINEDGNPVSTSNPLATTATISGDVNVDSTSIDTSGYIGKASGTNADFTTAYASETTITLSDLPSGVDSITADDIISVVQIATDGTVTKTYTRDDIAMTTSGADPTTVTITGASFEATDTFVVYTNIARPGGGTSAGAAGSGGIVVGYEKGSYTFDASAQTITFSGLPTLKLEQIQRVTNVSTGDIIFEPSDAAKGGSITSNVLTLDYDTTSMSDSDNLIINLQYNNSEDYSTGTQKISVNNPEWAHYTSTQHLVDETNLDEGTYRYIITQEGYRGGTLHLKGSGGVTFTLWASLDDTADDSADTGWVDVSSTFLGVDDLVDGEDIYFFDTNVMPDRFMVKVVTSDETNAIDVWYKKI